MSQFTLWKQNSSRRKQCISWSTIHIYKSHWKLSNLLFRNNMLMTIQWKAMFWTVYLWVLISCIDFQDRCSECCTLINGCRVTGLIPLRILEVPVHCYTHNSHRTLWRGTSITSSNSHLKSRLKFSFLRRDCSQRGFAALNLAILGWNWCITFLGGLRHYV